MAFFWAALAQTQPAAPMVDVELAMLGADGHPVAGADAVIKVIGRKTFGPPAPEIAARTDSQGIAHFQIPAGTYRLFVEVDGAYGSVGTTEFAPGKVARPWMPRMVAPGGIDGIYDTHACQGDVRIHTNAGKNVEVLPTAPGHFHLTGTAGRGWLIWVTANGQRCAETALLSDQVIPGRTLFGIVLSPPQPASQPPPSPAPQPFRIQYGGGSGKQGVWVKGTVRDATGRPIPNASVMALGTYFGAIRMYQRTARTETDADGHYEIRGEGGLSGFSASMLASVPGHPPAWAWPAFAEIPVVGPHSEIPEPPVQDLVIPSKSGSLNITVLRRGQPVPGIHVAVYLENVNLRDVWARGEDDASAIQDAAYPTATTDGNGSAEFRNLLPGRYRVVASAKAEATRASLGGLSRLAGSTVQVAGIPVRVDETTSYKLNLYEQQNRGRLQVMQTGGNPFAGSAAVSFGPGDTIAWNSNLALDSSGIGQIELDHAGLWKMSAMFRDWPIDIFPIQEPYFLASGYLATSPNLDGGHPPVLNARRMDPGSVRLVVEDIHGKPCQVTIQVYSGGDQFFGTTDENGEIVFTGLTSGQKYFTLIGSYGPIDVEGNGDFSVLRPAGASAVKVDIWQGTVPLPEELIAEPGAPRPEFVAQPNTEIRLAIRAVSRRYIYGTIRAPANAGPGPWTVNARTWNAGEFVAGPFPPGDVQLAVASAGKERFRVPVHVDSTSNSAIRLDIDVAKYRIESVDEPPASDPLAAKAGTAMMGMGGISSQAGGASQLRGKVLLADGTTPALGAQVLYWHPRQAAPSLFAMTDALGNLEPRGIWETSVSHENGASEGPKSATVIAFLPGATGAVVKTVSRADDFAHIVLPPPLSLSGRVTVGGASPVQRPGVIQVTAAHQGGGFLDPYLCVTSTADAEGTFELAGLTPGAYQVQAALDNIWLSQTVSLKIDGTAPPPVKLAIPLPGVPVRLQLRDASGKAVSGASITLDRGGPLAVLWPKEWKSDALGSVWIPTLEAGPHTASAAGGATRVRFEVPAQPGGPVIVDIRLR